jgi:ABC-type amino acid transport substrate-binding protein
MNFSIELTIEDKEKWGTLYSNGTTTGAMAKVINKEVDLTIGKFAITERRMKFMSATFSYYSSPLIVMVPRGKDVTPIERLMKPFQDAVWIWVVLVFAVAFLVIGFLKIKCDEAQRDFVFGKRNREPTLNLFTSFIGGSLAKLPTRNFARTLLCMFLLYSLIVRNSYTGALFNFIKTSNVRRPPLNSIDAMVEENFTFYMIKSAQELTKEVKRVYDRRHLMDPLEVPMYRSKLTDSSFRGG